MIVVVAECAAEASTTGCTISGGPACILIVKNVLEVHLWCSLGDGNRLRNKDEAGINVA